MNFGASIIFYWEEVQNCYSSAKEFGPFFWFQIHIAKLSSKNVALDNYDSIYIIIPLYIFIVYIYLYTIYIYYIHNSIYVVTLHMCIYI